MNETKKCPFCAEEIAIEAKKCKHCSEWLNKVAKLNALSTVNTPNNSMPIGLIFAAIFEFVDSLFWFVIAYLQADLYFRYHTNHLGLISLWNFFIAFAVISIGIGILKRKKWGYDWGVGSAMLNILLQGYQAYKVYNTWDKEGLFLLVLLIITQGVILVLLLLNKDQFPQTKKNWRRRTR
ncbi:MAG: hypothetical protein JXR48_01420 [Candidatus Delongbacteria bacterium]|nr:hypothetical protein [Candidatus Delongbacteria bacterium]